MGRRGERRLKALYDLTERLAGPEGNFPAKKRFKFVSESLHTREESGTCNVCSSPCSSCLHFNRTVLVMESNIEFGFSSNMLQRKETRNSSFVSVDKPPILQSRACHDQHGTSEMSNQLSASSSHDSYSENAESKATLKASATYDTSEDVDMPPKVSLSDVIEDDIGENNVTSHNLLSSCTFPTFSAHHKQLSDPVPERDKLECHADNVSCITAVRDVRFTVHDQNMVFNKKDEVSFISTKSMFDKGTQEPVEIVATHGYCDNEIENNHAKSPSSSSCSKEPLQKKNSGSKDFKRDLSSQHLVGSVVCSKQNVDSSFGGLLAADSVDERKSTSDCEHNQTGHTRSSLGIPKNVTSCLETGNGIDIGITSDETLKCSASNEPPEKSSSLLDASRIKGSKAQSQLTPEGGRSSQSDAEDDVKVCDICGDAGREEFLAICSKCSDGAEHTYCVRVMLDKVPEGDWLCEECKLKVDKSKSVTQTSKKLSLNEKSQNVGCILNPKLLHKLDTKTLPEEKGINKGLQSPQISSKKHSGNVEISAKASKRISQSIGGSETGSPKKKSVLSRDSSFKNLDVGKGKPASMSQPCGHQTANTSHVFVRSPTLSVSDTSRNRSQLETPREHFSKSTSFNSSNVKGKVIHLIESSSHKQRMSRESASGDRRKDGLIRTLSKSASFKGLSLGSSTESATVSSLNSPRTEDLKGMKSLKESTLVRKNSFVADRSIVSPSPIAGTIIPPLKLDQKAARYTGESNNISEPHILGTNRGSEDAIDFGCNEVKRQPLNGMCNSEGQKLSVLVQRGISDAAEATHRDNKAKDSSFSSSSRQAVPSGSRVLRCQKCNETGHARQFCSIDKLRISLLKPCAEQIQRVGSSKDSKWRDAVESAISKNRMQKGGTLSDEVADFCSELPSTETPSPSLVGRTNEQEMLRYVDDDHRRTAAAIDLKRKAREEEDAIISNLNELNANPFTETLCAQASVLGNPLRAFAFPEFDFIWQGAFEVMRTGSVHELFDGVQAHLSNCASPKVLDVMTKFSSNMKLEEVPRRNTWPTQFQISGPKEYNIALFFFAKDIESYEKNYGKLLDNILKNDLALKGHLDGAELLVFPSTTLPNNSQRWNMLFFLWGVFIERRIDCVKSLSGFQKKPCSSSLDMEPMVQDVSSPIVAEVSQKKDLCENHDKKLYISDISPKANIRKCSIDAVLEPVSSSRQQNKICQAEESPVGQASLPQGAVANKLPTEPSSHFYSISYYLESIGQAGTSRGNYSESTPQLNPMHLCTELKKDAIYLKDVSSNSGKEKAMDSLSHVHPVSLQISSSKSDGLSPHTVSPFCGQGIGAQSTSDMKTREEDIQVKSEAAVDEDCIELDHLSWESRSNKKRSRCCSIDTISQASGETSKSTDEVILCGEMVNCISSEDQKDQKKMKLDTVGNAGSSSSREETLSGRLSSKVHPFLCNLNENPHRDGVYDKNLMPETSSAERYFLPVNKGSVMDTRSDNFIHVLSSDDEDSTEYNAPNLELALGGMKKPSEKEATSLFFSMVGRNNKQEKLPADDKDDVPASLSLSLAVPNSDKELESKPITKTESLLPERPSVNTSLLLFGGSTNT